MINIDNDWETISSFIDFLHPVALAASDLSNRVHKASCAFFETLTAVDPDLVIHCSDCHKPKPKPDPWPPKVI